MTERESGKGPAIEVCGLTRLFGTLSAVNKISFSVPHGCILGLLGPNGAGKSTTLKMLTTLLPPTSGTAKIGGFDLVTQPACVRKHIGYVPQLVSADGDLTGYENLLLSGRLYGLSRQFREKRIQEVLDFMGLLEDSSRLVHEYSGGMIRRLEIAQALLHLPEVLFLDEPTVGLDPSARQVLWHRIKVLRKQFGTTILMTTHDMEEADVLCDTVAFMYEGRIVGMDSPTALKAALGANASLSDVFVKFTGSSLTEGDSYSHVRQTRRTISHRK